MHNAYIIVYIYIKFIIIKTLISLIANWEKQFVNMQAFSKYSFSCCKIVKKYKHKFDLKFNS